MKTLFALCLVMMMYAVVPLATAQQSLSDEYNYFSHRLARINDQVNLTSDQQTKLKPIIEQETALMEQVYGNPVLSRKQKLKKYWSIINKSNPKIRQILTSEQVPAFDTLLAQQKQKYEKLMQEAKEKS